MVNGIELNVREKMGVKIALWINHSDYRDAKDLFFHVKKSTPLPKALDFDFSQHPRKYYHTKKNYNNKNKNKKSFKSGQETNEKTKREKTKESGENSRNQDSKSKKVEN